MLRETELGKGNGKSGKIGDLEEKKKNEKRDCTRQELEYPMSKKLGPLKI